MPSTPEVSLSSSELFPSNALILFTCSTPTSLYKDPHHQILSVKYCQFVCLLSLVSPCVPELWLTWTCILTLGLCPFELPLVLSLGFVGFHGVLIFWTEREDGEVGRDQIRPVNDSATESLSRVYEEPVFD